MYTTAPKLVVLAFLLVGGVVATVNYIDVEKVNQPNGRPRMLSVFSNVTRLLFRRQRSVQQDTSKHDVTDAERVAALKAHNDLRREVTPSASDMTHMIWNWELENMAQQWADACHYKHGQPHRDPSPFTSIGQNLWINTGGFDLVGAVNAWYGEVKYYDYNTNKCQPNKVCGHFTQVVWSSSREVGCGISYCEQTKGWNNRKAYYIVCNYGPPGNYVGTKPYKTGSPCSACPQSQPKCMNKLCRENPSCKSKKCLNGGVVDSSTCECKCEDGFHGSSCQSGAVGDGIGRLRMVTMLLSLLISGVVFG